MLRSPPSLVVVRSSLLAVVILRSAAARFVSDLPPGGRLQACFGNLPFEADLNNGFACALLNGLNSRPARFLPASLFFLLACFVVFLGLLLTTYSCETQESARSGPEVSVRCLLLLLRGCATFWVPRNTAFLCGPPLASLACESAEPTVVYPDSQVISRKAGAILCDCTSELGARVP